MNTEEIRNQFMPKKAKILLVGESPPDNGTFFYVKSNMTTFRSRPFEKVFGVHFADNREFLKYFQSKGCYLDDLSHEPVNHLPRKEREQILKDNIPLMAQRLSQLQPHVVCIVLKKIEGYVREAIKEAGIGPQVYVLPFPGLGHQDKFIDKMTEIVDVHLNA